MRKKKHPRNPEVPLNLANTGKRINQFGQYQNVLNSYVQLLQGEAGADEEGKPMASQELVEAIKLAEEAKTEYLRLLKFYVTTFIPQGLPKVGEVEDAEQG